MAEFKLLDFIQTPVGNGGASTPDMPPHVDGNFLVLVVQSHQYNGTPLAAVANPDSWDVEYNSGTSSSGKCLIMSVTADSDNMTPPTIQVGSATQSDMAMWVLVFTGEHPTDKLDVSTISFVPTNTTTHTSPTVATNFDNQMVFRLLYIDYTSSGDRDMSPLENYMMVGPPQSVSGYGRLSAQLGWTIQEVAGDVPNVTVYTEAYDTGSWTTFSIRAADGATMPPRIDPSTQASEIIHSLTNHSLATYPFGSTDVDVTTILSEINGRTVVDSEIEYPSQSHMNGAYNVLSTRFNVNDSINGCYAIGLGINTINLENELVAVTVGTQTPQDVVRQTRDNGMLVGFLSSNNGAKIISPCTRTATPNQLLMHTVVFEMANTDYDLPVTPVGAPASFDPTDTDTIILASNPVLGGRTELTWQELRKVKTLTVTGEASTENAASMSTFKDAVAQKYVLTVLDQQQGATGQWLIKQPLKSNGYFADQNFSVEYIADRAGKRQQAIISPDTLGITLDGGSQITNGIFSGGTRHHFRTTGTGKAHTWSNLTLINANPEFSAGDTYSGTVTLSGCKELIHNNADLSNLAVIYDGCVDNQAVTISGANQSELQEALNKLATHKFVNSTLHGLLIHRTSGTGPVSLDAPQGISVDKTHYTSVASSTLQITIGDSGANFGDLTYGEAATDFTILNSKTYTVTGIVPGSYVAFFEDDEADPQNMGTLKQEDNNSSGTFIYNHNGSVVSGYIQIIKAGYKEENVPVTLGNENSGAVARQKLENLL